MTSPNPGAFGSGIGVEAAAGGGVAVCTNTYEGVTTTTICVAHGASAQGDDRMKKSHTSSVTATGSGVDSGSSGEAANTLAKEARETLFAWVEDPTNGVLLIKETFGATAYIVDCLCV